MQKEVQLNHWASQSAVTFLGPYVSKAIDEVPPTPRSLRDVSRELVAHYMGASDGSSRQITGVRLKEVDLRYADRMFNRLLEEGIPKLNSGRKSE